MKGRLEKGWERYGKKVYGRKPKGRVADLQKRAFLAGASVVFEVLTERPDDPDKQVQAFLALQTELRQQINRTAGTNLKVQDGQLTGAPLTWWDKLRLFFAA